MEGGGTHGVSPDDPEVRLRRLLPGGDPVTPAALIEELGFWRRPLEQMPAGRPRVLLNMVSSADGRATLQGRSGSLSGPADRALFHALRLPADAVLVGAGTVRAERYGRVIRDQAGRSLRRSRGMSAEPLACIASRSLAIDTAIPLLAEPDARVLVLTASEGGLGDCSADVGYVRAGAGGELDLAAALHVLGEEHGVQLLLCEGGPHLAGSLLTAGLLDELFLSLSPRLAGGDPEGGGPLRILAGPELLPPVELALLGVHEHDAGLFVRYGVVAPDRVSRETMESSSLAR